jgi:hypothetical protein
MVDARGSKTIRSRLLKAAIQRLSNRLDFPVYVCHFSAGTSKWNKIEHKMFSFITYSWRGYPLISHEVIINLIAHTVTKTGLGIKAELDKGKYIIGQKISDDEFMKIKLKAAKFHGDWNYSILPTFD